MIPFNAMSAVGMADPELLDCGIFFAGFMGSSVIWSFLCAAMVDRVFGKISAQWARLTYRLCAIAFFLLALGTIKGTLSSYLASKHELCWSAAKEGPARGLYCDSNSSPAAEPS
jgi:hypothetical protein